MKTLLFTYKFLFMIFLTLPLTLCSKDNDELKKQDFEPITINLSGLNIQLDDTSFTTEGFNFKCFRALSPTSLNDGILLAYGQNNNASMIELDLNNTTGISKISISLFNNCSACLDVQILNGDQIITEIKETELDSGVNLVEVDIISTISSLKIASGEAVVYSIKLE